MAQTTTDSKFFPSNLFDRPLWRKLLIIPPVLAGVGVLVFVFFIRAQPGQSDVREIARPLRVITIKKVKFVPRILGYGTAQPSRIWRAVAEVKGRVKVVHKRLQSGEIIKADEVLLKIDPVEFELAVAQLNAEIEQAGAQLDELKAKKSNYEASLKIEEKSLVLAKNEFVRKQDLYNRNAASAEAVEKANRNYLVQKQNVQNLKNSLKILPAEEKALKANQVVKQNKLKQRELDLKHATIKAPFDCRLGEVNIEVGQFVPAGEKLFEVHGLDAVEIEAKMSLEKGRNLIPPKLRKRLTSPPNFEVLRKIFKIEANVRLLSGIQSKPSRGEVIRMREQFDPKTRTVGVIVRINDPYKNVVPGERPPIIKGAFCEVELRGQPREAILIPAHAYHGGEVFVVDKNNRLQRRKVAVDFAQANFLVLQNGLTEGERLIVSDPAPAIDGQLVDPVETEAKGSSLLQGEQQ